MNITRIRRSVLAASAAVVFPVALGITAPMAFADNPAQPFGPGCASVPTSGEGSVDGMADDPVATAASNNPELKTLTAAVKAADLVDTLNNAEDITVFAPTNAAFEKIPKADLDALLADREELTKVLTYHVVGETVEKADLPDGDFKTLEGTNLTTSGSGNNFEVNDSAKIVCGDVQTSNATVQLIDTVLMPK